ncbi:MAG: F0F1 ATP synthase subunit gamma, partial [Sagittula sp.]
VKQVGFVNADAIAHNIIQRFAAGEFDVCTLFYSEFKSVISQIPTAQQIIPAKAPATQAATGGASAIYDYEPDAGQILSDLIPRNISVQIFRALLENAAGEMRLVDWEARKNRQFLLERRARKRARIAAQAAGVERTAQLEQEAQ